MNIKEQKKGISLIVLVITIIVMIILVAAIILSLDGSDIIERAKGAQSSNDVATAKDIVSLAKSEWSFERKEGYDTFRVYAEAKLEEAGFDMDKTYVEDSGKVLFDTAARFARAGVEIGTEVTGYTLNSTSSYTTSGKENTYCWDENEEMGGETNPQPATITRDSAITWTYVGADKDGNAMLAGSVTSTTPKVKLGGSGGYLNGPAELDKICEAMYSTVKGTSRSMNIDDITRVLEYTGETSAYYNKAGIYTPTKEIKTIGQIAKEINYDMSGFEISVPENGKEVATYKADYFEINKTADAKEYNMARADLVYPTNTNTKLTTTYWLSSPCVRFDLSGQYAVFGMHYSMNDKVRGSTMFCSYTTNVNTAYNEFALRPIVILTSNVEVSYNGTVAIIK